MDTDKIAEILEENKRLKELLKSKGTNAGGRKPTGYLLTDEEKQRIASLKPLGIITVKLISCSDLLNADAGDGGLSDPYVTMKLTNGTTVKSKRFNNNLNPVFNEVDFLNK